jgi:hypothetical protein
MTHARDAHGWFSFPSPFVNLAQRFSRWGGKMDRRSGRLVQICFCEAEDMEVQLAKLIGSKLKADG